MSRSILVLHANIIIGFCVIYNSIQKFTNVIISKNRFYFSILSYYLNYCTTILLKLHVSIFE